MTNKEMAVVLQPYLEEAAKNDPFLAKSMENKEKSIEECIEYVIFKTVGTGKGSALVDGEEIMRHAIQYYKDTTIVMPNIHSKAEKKPTEDKAKQDKPKAAKKAEIKPNKTNEFWAGELFNDL